VSLLTPIRLKFALLIAVSFLFAALTPHLRAQDDPETAPLGDIARSLRGQTAPRDFVIDNDNLTQVVDDAESRRESGLLPTFSLDPGYNTVRVSSPDVSCSLSFTATSSSSSDQLLWSDLPRTELSKLDGPATIDGDALQVSLHNGTSWDLREVVIGLTIGRTQAQAAVPDYANTTVPPFTSGTPTQSPFQKLPDTTILLHIKGSAAPTATAVFRTSLNFALFPDQEWHWAIVKAKGIPPQATPEAVTQSAPTDGSIPPVPPASNGLPPSAMSSANVPQLAPASSTAAQAPSPQNVAAAAVH
jgi:hypothetical protein